MRIASRTCGLLAACALEVQAVDGGDGQLDGQADGVVGERDALRALHLLRELAQAAA